MSFNNGWSSMDRSNSYSRKRPRDFDENSDQSSPRHQNRRFRPDPEQSPRRRQRRRGDTYGHGQTYSLSDSFCQAVWSLGDSERFDFRREIPELVQRIEIHFADYPEDVLRAFRIAVAELPHKLPHFALLISLLSVTHHQQDPTALDADVAPPSIGLQIIRDLSRSFQLHIDNRRWRSTRLFLHLFGHLHALSRPLVSSRSLLALLKAIFSATTDELTCTGARADECIRMVCEGLLRSGLLTNEENELRKEIAELMESIRVHMVVNRRFDRSLFHEDEALSQYIDPIEELVAALNSAKPAEVLPVLDEPFAPLLEMRMRESGEESVYPAPFDLPTVLLPPDAEDSSINAQPAAPKSEVPGGPGPVPLDCKDRTGYLGMKILINLFTDNSVPGRVSPDGVVLRTLVSDIIDVFEVNRKECAKILLELPRWVGRGTFKTKSVSSKPKQPLPEDRAAIAEVPEKGSDWVLEHLILESILGSVFAMPVSSLRTDIYYYSLIVELCRLSPTTVAPGLGKCVRRLYGGLGEVGSEVITTRLNAEGIRRFAEWFAIHLSNFSFSWGWKDWVEVAELPLHHPKRVFVSRVLELEVRLSYFDRIKGTVPTSFFDSGLMNQEAPGPVFEYDNTEHRDHLAALDVIQLLKRKEAVSRLIDYLDKMKERLVSEGIPEPIEDVTRDVAVQALLNVGSRSFSHFLNVLERYLELLRNLTNSGDSRLSLLKIVSRFWRKNPQFELIVIDKLLEYRVVDPIDVLRHAFVARQGDGWGEIHFWDIVKLTIEKVTRRVKVSRTKVDRLRKAEEDARGVERAAGGGRLLDPPNNAAVPTERAVKDAAEQATLQQGAEDKKDGQLEAAVSDQARPESELKMDALQARREEMVSAEKEVESNVAEQIQVLVEACKMLSRCRWEAEQRERELDPQHMSEQMGDENGGCPDEVSLAWRAWWLRGWCREFCCSFAAEITEHFDQLTETMGSEETGKGGRQQMKDDIGITKEWVEYIGVQSL